MEAVSVQVHGGDLISTLMRLQRGSTLSKPFASMAWMIGESTLAHTALLLLVIILFFVRTTISYAAQEVAILAIGEFFSLQAYHLFRSLNLVLGLNSVVLFLRLHLAKVRYNRDNGCPATSLVFQSPIPLSDVHNSSSPTATHTLPECDALSGGNDGNDGNVLTSSATLLSLQSSEQ